MVAGGWLVEVDWDWLNNFLQDVMIIIGVGFYYHLKQWDCAIRHS